MANLVWLDDAPDEVGAAIEWLRRSGHNVQVAATEETVIKRLVRQDVDLLITDLFRTGPPATLAGRPKRLRGANWNAGWRFYDEVVREFPSVPVVICTAASDEANLRTANDYNLKILPKQTVLSTAIVRAVDQALAAQRTVYTAPVEIPAIVTVDLAKVNGALIRYLAQHPEALHDVSWQTFEGLIGRLLAEMDYRVFHTRLAKDGGVDLLAVKRDDLGTPILYAIDCKKYASNRQIGPEPVRAIYGVIMGNEASVGMIVTTSTFGPAARQLQRQHRRRISLKDYGDVQEWIKTVADDERW